MKFSFWTGFISSFITFLLLFRSRKDRVQISIIALYVACESLRSFYKNKIAQTENNFQRDYSERWDS